MSFSLEPSCITFDSETYSAGDSVSGIVSFTTDKPLSARFIKIDLLGEVRVQYVNKNKIAGDVRYLWKSSAGESILPAGKHEFAFSFNPLPDDCEPSFRGPKGTITYRVRLLINRPWAFDLKTEKTFSVTGYKDARLLLKNENAGRGYSLLHVPGIFFPDGHISMMVVMMKLRYAPGETVQMLVQIENNSSKPCHTIGLKFSRLCHYHNKPQHTPCTVGSPCPVYGDDKTDSEEILTSKKYPICVKPFSSEDFRIELKINKNLVPMFESPMISTGYQLRLTCTSGSLTNNKVRIHFPLTLRRSTDKSDKELPPAYFE